MAIDIGLIAYNTYSKVLCSDGECNCEAWGSLGKRKQDAWRHAAVAVSQYLDQCKREMEEGSELEG
jgi:hypothetical protein